MVGLGPGHIVYGDPALPPKKRAAAPDFRPMSVVAKRPDWIKMPLGREVNLGPGNIVFDGDPAPSLSPEKGDTAPPFLAHVL